MKGQAAGSSKIPSSSRGNRGRVDIYGYTGSQGAGRRFSVRLCLIISRRETTVLSSVSSLTLAT